MTTTTAKKIKTVPCTKCGQQINGSANFCNFCGQKNEPKDIPLSTLEPIETKNSRDILLELLKQLQVKTNLTLKDLREAEALFESMPSNATSAQELTDSLMVLAGSSNRYLYSFALTKLSSLLSPDKFNAWAKELIKADPPLNIPSLLDAAPQIDQSTFELLWAYLPNLNSLWLYLKYIHLATKHKLKINNTIKSFLANKNDRQLQKKLTEYLQLSYFPELK